MNSQHELPTLLQFVRVSIAPQLLTHESFDPTPVGHSENLMSSLESTVQIKSDHNVTMQKGHFGSVPEKLCNAEKTTIPAFAMNQFEKIKLLNSIHSDSGVDSAEFQENIGDNFSGAMMNIANDSDVKSLDALDNLDFQTEEEKRFVFIFNLVWSIVSEIVGLEFWNFTMNQK